MVSRGGAILLPEPMFPGSPVLRGSPCWDCLLASRRFPRPRQQVREVVQDPSRAKIRFPLEGLAEIVDLVPAFLQATQLAGGPAGFLPPASRRAPAASNPAPVRHASSAASHAIDTLWNRAARISRLSRALVGLGACSSAPGPGDGPHSNVRSLGVSAPRAGSRLQLCAAIPGRAPRCPPGACVEVLVVLAGVPFRRRRACGGDGRARALSAAAPRARRCRSAVSWAKAIAATSPSPRRHSAPASR